MKKILFFGDSITVGVGASSPQQRYSSQVVARLNREAELYAESNYGASGQCLSDFGLRVLPDAIAERPDVFVMQHGVNDNAVGFSPGVFLWSYRETVRKIKEALPDAAIVCVTSCPCWSEEYSFNDVWLNLCNAGIQEIAALENTLVAQNYFLMNNRRELFHDDGHPNDEGYAVMAEAIVAAIKAGRVQRETAFDFIAHGSSSCRICNYVIEPLPQEAATDDGWIQFCDLGSSTFSYRSDYGLKINTPFDSISENCQVIVNGKQFAECVCNYRHGGTFFLPASKNFANVRFEKIYREPAVE